jgi:hypothetical protein
MTMPACIAEAWSFAIRKTLVDPFAVQGRIMRRVQIDGCEPGPTK